MPNLCSPASGFDSTGVIINDAGAPISKDLYLPYGDVRDQWRSGALATQTATPASAWMRA